MIVFDKRLPNNLHFLVSNEEVSEVYKIKNQMHGREILLLSDVLPYEDIDCDGLATFSQTPKMSIRTADCIALACVGKKGHALLHIGWKGLALRIYSKAIIHELAPFYFFIGPHICGNCYEVHENFKNYFPKSNAFERKGEKLFFSLERELQFRLKNIYPKAEIESSDLCTKCDQRFFSVRRDNTTERNWNILKKS